MTNESTKADRAEHQSGRNGARRAGAAVMGITQDAAGVMRDTADKAAARLPDAMATAQVAAQQTQRQLDAMPNEALLIGTSFSAGFGLGLLFAGANRLLVLLAMLPAAAMAATIFGRDPERD